ncbi:MAG: ankyrin repeat domain-containing protein [Planctomycetes bacterium]|nr:ankyrin repeat domain-containing protein [Planctomycetota bacterium]
MRACRVIVLFILLTHIGLKTHAGFFAQKVWPILKNHCVKCHGPDKKGLNGRTKIAKGILRLHHAEGILKGGLSGQCVIPGKPELSTLYTTTILPADHQDRMPARGPKISAEQSKTLKKWIADGAKFDGWEDEQSSAPKTSAQPYIPKTKSLREAIAKKDLQGLESHIRQQKQVDLQAKGGFTALHYAVMKNFEEAVDMLLKMGANPNTLSSSKLSPFHYAIKRAPLSIIKKLLKNGADLKLANADGWSPLHIASAHDRVEVVDFLLAQGADVKALSNAGGTALHEASVSGSRELILLLLKNGVNPKALSHDGKKALDHAKEYKNKDAIELLQKK